MNGDWDGYCAGDWRGAAGRGGGWLADGMDVVLSGAEDEAADIPVERR